jgi:hypothetical protein
VERFDCWVSTGFHPRSQTYVAALADDPLASVVTMSSHPDAVSENFFGENLNKVRLVDGAFLLRLEQVWHPKTSVAGRCGGEGGSMAQSIIIENHKSGGFVA